MFNFCCPFCKSRLLAGTTELDCPSCDRTYPIVDGIPDFVLSETEDGSLTETDKTWLDPEIVEARDTMYRLCARELRGMAFCMREIGSRTGPGCRILEVGMGTGHFTRRLAEIAKPGTQIYAFDYSWPIIKVAKTHANGLSGVALFRANARGSLPFESESFDILLLRLAPLGPHGLPNVQAGYELLKPGGWYFEAGWKPARYETPPVEWAVQNGFESAYWYEWGYRRTQTAQERRAFQFELERLALQGSRSAKEALEQGGESQIGLDEAGSIKKVTYEHLLIARKPDRK